MNKKFFKSKTIVSAAVWLIAGIAAEMGYAAEVMGIVQMLATAGVVYGFRDALK